jgi:hypothetical protein
MADDTLYVVRLYIQNNGEYVITKNCESFSPYKEIHICSSYKKEPHSDERTYNYDDFMLSIPTSIKKIKFSKECKHNKLFLKSDFFSFIPPHIEELSINYYFIDEEKELCLQPLNNLPYELKKIKIYFFKKNSYSYSYDFRITTREHLPSGYKYIQLSQFIKLPFGCILKLFSFGDSSEYDTKRTFSNIDNIVIVFISVYDKRTLPIPESN